MPCVVLEATALVSVVDYEGHLKLTTARDLLYKYFGQLELLELRFAEIKVSFGWWVADYSFSVAPVLIV